MRKNIEIPLAQNVYIVAIREWDQDFLAQHWNIYLANDQPEEFATVWVVSRGKDKDRLTTTLRHPLGDVKAKTVVKIEFISTQVLSFTNEYLVTFFVGNKLFERTYVFEPNTISEKNIVSIPILNCEGVLAR